MNATFELSEVLVGNPPKIDQLTELTSNWKQNATRSGEDLHTH